MAMIESKGICVRAWDWSETSQTAAIFTPEHGVIRMLAKGSKRPGAPFSGGLEPCTIGSFACIDRPNSELALLTSWDLEDPLMGVRSQLDRYRVAMIALELVPRMVRDRDPHPGAYDVLRELLSMCAHEPFDLASSGERSGYAALLRFMWTMLDEIGAMPILDHDVVTDASLTEAPVYGFSPDYGGMTSDPGPDDTHGSESGSGPGRAPARRVWRVRAMTRTTLLKLLDAQDDISFSDVTPDDLRRACTLLAAYTSERIGAEIPSLRWILEAPASGVQSGPIRPSS